MSGIMHMLVAAKTAVVSAITDAFFNQVTLLLNTGSTNGAQNNTFLDSGTANGGVGFTITRNPATGPNAPTQGTFSPFSQTGWSNYFDGTDDYLAIADNALLRFGAGAFTLEAWIWRNASGAAHTIYAKGGASTGIVFQVTSTNVLRFTHTTTNIDSAGTIAANSWTHVAVVREGTGADQTKLYINGAQDGQGMVSTDFTQTEEVRIGTDRGATADFNGYISNLRFVKGTALYTIAFTPSTTPLTTTSQGATSTEVELLTCQSNRFLDNSSNAFAITASGTPRVQAFSPFAPTAAYDSAVVGGSGYFDGSSYLTVGGGSSLAFGSGNFSLEMFVYQTSSGTLRKIYDARPSATAGNYPVLDIDVGNVARFLVDSTVLITGTTVIPANTWAHVLVSRVSGNLRLFVNGVQDGSTVSNSTNFANATARPAIAVRGSTLANDFFIGYISSVRVLIGSGFTSVTVPTAPLTAITNTSLLLNFTNAGIFDSTAKNNLETVGNAQVASGTYSPTATGTSGASTIVVSSATGLKRGQSVTGTGIGTNAVVTNIVTTTVTLSVVNSGTVSGTITFTDPTKFGTTSMYFDGSGDYLFMPSTATTRFGSANWTIELWFRASAIGARQILISMNSVAAGYGACNVNLLANGKIGLQISESGSSWKFDDTTTGLGSALSANTWYYLAVTRAGATVTVYINASSIGTYTLTATTTSLMTNDTRNVLGINPDLTNQPFNGYLDEVRITNGVVRTITTPTDVFLVQ
jgi:hypothetical protein